MGPNALVREPAELPDANAMSWTVESVNSRGSVNAVAYRPDGKQLATGGDDGTIRLWDTSSGKLVRMLLGEPVGSLSWSKDGKVLTALRPGDVQAREWDADTGRLLRRVLGTVTPGTRTARSPDGKQTVTADDKGVRITDTATGKPLHVLEETGHIRYYNCSWSPDGRRLAFAYQFPGENGLRVMEAATGRPGPALAEYERAGVWSPDGKIFATCGRDGRAHLLEVGTYRLLRTLEGDGGDGTALAWSADGNRLAMGAHSAVRVWSVQTGKQLWKKDKRAIAVAWSPDGRRLATTDNSNDKAALRLWEAETGKLLCEHPLSPEGALAWSPDGKRLVALPMWGEEGLMIDAETGSVHRKLKAGKYCSVRWSSDGKTFTSLGNQGQLREWDAATGEVRRTTQLPGVVGYSSSAAWSPDGLLLAWASGDAIHLDGVAGEPIGVLMPLGPFGQLAVTADGHYRGNARIERAIRMVVQKRDGTTDK
jgi:WD40 repeat protein